MKFPNRTFFFFGDAPGSCKIIAGSALYSHTAITHAKSVQPDSATVNTNVTTDPGGIKANSIVILRKAVAEAKRLVRLYSIGRDSGVMLQQSCYASLA